MEDISIISLAQIERLPVRAVNTCLNAPLPIDSLSKLLEYYKNNLDFLKLKNCGELTNKELIRVSKKYLNLHDVEFLPEFFTIVEYLHEFLYADVSRLRSYEEQFTKKRLQIFNLINLLLESYFDKRDAEIIRLYINDLKDLKTLREVGQDFKLTRERVRQIKTYNLEDFYNALAVFFDQNPNIKHFTQYQSYFTDGIMVVSEHLKDKLNKSEDVNFRLGVYLRLIPYMYSEYYQVESKFRNIQIITDKSIEPRFKLNEFIQDLDRRMMEKIKFDYFLNFDEYINGFKKPDYPDFPVRITNGLKNIITQAYKIGITSSNNLHFACNCRKKNFEYAYEILKEADKILSLNEIFSRIKHKYPKFKSNHLSLKSAINNEDVFIYISKTGYYGLKEWEGVKPNIKGGTIRDIVEEYIREHGGPQHINDITEYVNKFRNTNPKNVLENLKLARSGRFKILPNGFVDLPVRNR